MRSLPRGATAVDFAYSVHTDVGNQCVGARINGKMVPLRTRLQNGDIVEIITQAGHKPSRDWLTFVATSRARSKIKHVLQGEERARSIELGRRLFEKEARRFGLNPKTVLESEELAKFASEYGAQKADELLAHIGYGKLSARTVLQKAVPAGLLKEKPPDSGVVSAVKRVLRPGAAEDRIKVRGTDDVMVFRAKCCNPIRGERIVGYITRGKGVSVHSASCLERPQPDVRSRAPHRRRMGQRRRRSGAVHRASDDAGGGPQGDARRDQREGLGHQHQHHQHGSAHAGDDQQARIDMTVEIRDVKHLEKVIKSIKGVEGVLGVETRLPDA